MVQSLAPALRILPLIVLASSLGAQTLLHNVYGDGVIDRFGIDVASAGDVDGDGVQDFVSGATLDDEAGASFGSATVFSGRTGEELHRVFGDQSSSMYGGAVGAAGDVNNDGFDDFIVGANWDDGNAFRAGAATVYSGKDGSVLYELFGDDPNDYFGSSVGRIGDINGDEMDEFLVGAPNDDPGEVNGAGSAFVYDGATGTRLYTFEGDSDFALLGEQVAGGGDVNGDGTPDILVGVTGDSTNGIKSGAVRVYSGSNGSLLYTFRGPQAGDLFGAAIANAGDVDGDGKADPIVGATEYPQGPGYAQVFSGATGLPIHTVLGTKVAVLFGVAVSGLGDVDGDGRSEFLVGRVGFGAGVRAYDGATGNLLFDLGFPIGAGIGGSIDALGDTNGDGIPDFVTGAPSNNVFALNGGAAFVYSGQELPLNADDNTLSLSEGGVRSFALKAGASNAGSIYLLLGSTSGMSPGTTIPGGFTLPLNSPDPYFSLTLQSPGAAFLSNSLGILDGLGEGQATLSVQGGIHLSFVGLVVHFAAVVLELGPITPTFVSNAVPLVLAP